MLPRAFASDAQARRTSLSGSPEKSARQIGAVSQRTERVDELLRQEIGAIITRDVADPRVGFVTITEVETTPDLRHAKVWVSVIGQPAEREAAVEALRHAMPFIRHELGKRLRIKRIPDLHLHLDDTAERGTRILQLLAEIGSGESPAPDVPLTESLPTPVARVHQPEDLDAEPPSAVRQPVAARPRSHRTGHHPTTPRKGSGKAPRKGSR